MADLLEHDIQRTSQRAPFALDAEPLRSRAPISPEILATVVQFADFCLVLIAAQIASHIYLGWLNGQEIPSAAYWFASLLAAIVFVTAFRRLDGYTVRHLSRLGWQLNRLFVVWASTIAILTTIAFVIKVAENYSRGWAVTWAALLLGEMIVARVILQVLTNKWKAQGRLSRTVAIVGAGAVGENLVEKLRSAPGGEVRIAGIFDDRATRIANAIGGLPLRGTTDDLIKFAQDHRIDEIIIALPLRAAERIGEIVGKLRLLPVDLRLSIDSIAGAFPMRGVGETAAIPVIEILDRPLKHWNGVAKTVEDFTFGILGLLLVSPLMALIAIAIKLDSKGPVLFIQERFGFNNRSIMVKKFRTMYVEDSDPSGARRTVVNDPRVTRVGRFLRRFSLDELPQLFNVLSGEMSLVGPRPHALAQRAGNMLYYEAVGGYFHRHRVRPGMTGWAQIRGLRGEIDNVESARKRVEHDLFYIDNWSILFDLKIIIKTAFMIFADRNAY